MVMSHSIQDIAFKNSKGVTTSLKNFKAKAFLIVNVASKCGLTPQYEALQKLYKTYHDKGLEILAFPANEFLGQEPGTNQEIQDFCNLTYQVSFPINEKIIVKGPGQHLLYKTLTENKKTSVKNEEAKFENLLKESNLISGEPHDIKWNFEKFILDANGNIIERFFPDIAPDDKRVVKVIEELLK